MVCTRSVRLVSKLCCDSEWQCQANRGVQQRTARAINEGNCWDILFFLYWFVINNLPWHPVTHPDFSTVARCQIMLSCEVENNSRTNWFPGKSWDHGIVYANCDRQQCKLRREARQVFPVTSTSSHSVSSFFFFLCTFLTCGPYLYSSHKFSCMLNIIYSSCLQTKNTQKQYLL